MLIKDDKTVLVDVGVTAPPSDPGADLVVWFCREAYLEGHAVVIPTLGATFKRQGR
jgi:hypothetical protein